MKMEVFLAGLRHSMTAAGALLIPYGVTDAEGWATVSGAVIAIVGFGWSLWRKYARHQRTGSAA